MRLSNEIHNKKQHEDNQEGVLDCLILKLKCKELYMKNEEQYNDIFSDNINKISKIVNIFQKCLEVRGEEVLNDQCF